MPWCEQCAKYWAPSSMNPDGTCPSCGREVETPELKDAAESVADDERAPWHFKLMIAALAVYLVYRFWEIFT